MLGTEVTISLQCNKDKTQELNDLIHRLAAIAAGVIKVTTQPVYSNIGERESVDTLPDSIRHIIIEIAEAFMDARDGKREFPQIGALKDMARRHLALERHLGTLKV